MKSIEYAKKILNFKNIESIENELKLNKYEYREEEIESDIVKKIVYEYQSGTISFYYINDKLFAYYKCFGKYDTENGLSIFKENTAKVLYWLLEDIEFPTRIYIKEKEDIIDYLIDAVEYMVDIGDEEE